MNDWDGREGPLEALQAADVKGVPPGRPAD